MRMVPDSQPSGLRPPGTSRLPWRIPAPLTAGTGVVLLVGTILYGAVSQAPFHVGYLVVALLGAMLQVAAPFLDRPTVAPGMSGTGLHVHSKAKTGGEGTAAAHLHR